MDDIRPEDLQPEETTGIQPGLPGLAPPVTNIEKATDIDRVAPLDEQLDDSISVNGPTERAPERDERGRL